MLDCCCADWLPLVESRTKRTQRLNVWDECRHSSSKPKRESQWWWTQRYMPEGRGENYYTTWCSDPFIIVLRERPSVYGYTVIKMPHASLHWIVSHHPFNPQHKRTITMEILNKCGSCRTLRLLQSSLFSQSNQTSCIVDQSNTSDVSILNNTWEEDNSYDQGRKKSLERWEVHILFSLSAQVGHFYRLYLVARSTKKTPFQGLKTKLKTSSNCVIKSKHCCHNSEYKKTYNISYSNTVVGKSDVWRRCLVLMAL